MVDKEFYASLRQYLGKRTITPSLDQFRRKKVMRVVENFVLKDNQLFYTGPSRQYMRLVVLSEGQKQAVLQECHHNPDTGNHNGVRRTRDRVIAGYYWSTINADVTDWVKSCHHCQLNNPVKSVAPVLHPIKVKEAWQVVGMGLIGPLKETAKKNRYVMTMIDLYTKWVVAEPMQTNSASEVSAALISKMFLFGMVRKIISDQSREFVKQLNSRICQALNIKHLVSSGYHAQTTEKDEHINQNLICALRKYANKEHIDWDEHLQAIIYGINTTNSSTGYSPYYLLFHRHPLFPEMMGACPMRETLEVQDPEDELDQRLMDIKALNKKVLGNLERAQSLQKKNYPEGKQKQVREWSLEAGDEVLISENPEKSKVEDSLQDWQNPEVNTQIMQLEHSYSLSCVSDIQLNQ